MSVHIHTANWLIIILLFDLLDFSRMYMYSVGNEAKTCVTKIALQNINMVHRFRNYLLNLFTIRLSIAKLRLA